MADRFPSIEDFSEGQTETRGTGIGGGDTPEADDNFLARERAVLGDDAAQFAAPAESSSATVEDGDDDLLGGDSSYGSVSASREEITGFESSFPAIDTNNNNVAPGGTITGSGLPTSSYSGYSAPEDEPEVIKQWRERRDLALSHRADTSAAKQAETGKSARAAIDDFYNNYNAKKDKTVTQTRKEAEEFLENREDTSAGGTSWERIAKLVDLSGKGTKGGANGTGKEKFRELLVSLKKDDRAPGASGV